MNADSFAEAKLLKIKISFCLRKIVCQMILNLSVMIKQGFPFHSAGFCFEYDFFPQH